MNFKKNFKKAGVGLLVSAVAIGGAFAWLTNSDTAQKHNNISVGNISIKFDNQLNAIALSDNNAIPVTQEYAVDNLTIYTFDIVNDGTIAVDYAIQIKADGYANDFGSYDGKNAVKLVLVETPEGATTDDIKVLLKAGTVQTVEPEVEKASYENLAPGESIHYALVSYIDSHAANDHALGKSATYGLEVNAIQHMEAEPIVIQDVLSAQKMNDMVNSKVYFQLNDASGGAVDFNAYTYKLNGEEITGAKSTRMEAYQFDVTDKGLSGDVKLEMFESGNKIAEWTVNFD